MIGERINSKRRELKLSLRDLAQRADLTASYLSQVERVITDPSIKSLRKIANALKVPIKDKFGKKEVHRQTLVTDIVELINEAVTNDGD